MALFFIRYHSHNAEAIRVTLGAPRPPDLRQGGNRPQPQSTQVRFMRTLLVSAELIADEIPAAGGHRRFVPGPVTGEVTPLELSNNVRLPRCGYESMRVSGPRKPGKIRGESELSQRIISGLSPDAPHPGWRPKDAGPETQRSQVEHPRSFKHQREPTQIIRAR